MGFRLNEADMRDLTALGAQPRWAVPGRIIPLLAPSATMARTLTAFLSRQAVGDCVSTQSRRGQETPDWGGRAGAQHQPLSARCIPDSQHSSTSARRACTRRADSSGWYKCLPYQSNGG